MLTYIARGASPRCIPYYRRAFGIEPHLRQ